MYNTYHCRYVRGCLAVRVVKVERRSTRAVFMKSSSNASTSGRADALEQEIFVIILLCCVSVSDSMVLCMQIAAHSSGRRVLVVQQPRLAPAVTIANDAGWRRTSSH